MAKPFDKNMPSKTINFNFYPLKDCVVGTSTTLISR